MYHVGCLENNDLENVNLENGGLENNDLWFRIVVGGEGKWELRRIGAGEERVVGGTYKKGGKRENQKNY